MSKPVIGILGNLLISKDAASAGMERSYVNDEYVKAVLLGGGTPVILPVIVDREAIEEQIKRVDGLLISGGYDVNPLLYGEEPVQKQEFIYPDIDEHDIIAIRTAVEMNKPVLGICRGAQVLNVAFGGTLYQDLSQIEGCYIKHSQDSKRDMAGHTTEIFEGTKLYEIFGDGVLTNSFHHQSVKDIAPGFILSARAKDGVVEAIEKEGPGFTLAVQWHPEGMVARHPLMLELFKRLVDEARNNH